MNNHKAKNLLKGSRTFDWVFIALLTAINIILQGPLTLHVGSDIKIGFSFLPIVIGAYYYGILGGVLVSGLGDFITAFVFPTGAFNPLFTVTAIIVGLLFGLFLRGKINILNIILAVVSTQIICSLILNSLWIAVCYINISAFPAQVVARLVQVIPSIPVQIILIPIIIEAALKRININ